MDMNTTHNAESAKRARFGIFYSVPRYGSRDEFVGLSVYRDPAFPYAYETLALARRMTPSGYDADGQACDVVYFVADLADPYRRPVIARAPLDAAFDEIVF